LRPNYLVGATSSTVDARRAGNRKATWKNPPPMRRLRQRPQRGGWSGWLPLSGSIVPRAATGLTS